MPEYEENHVVNEEAVELMERGTASGASISIATAEQRRKINIEEVRSVFLNRNFRRGFSIFDENKDGFIDTKELKQMVKQLAGPGNPIPPDVVKRIMTISDQDNDGHLNYSEFVKMINNPQLNILFGRYLRTYVRGLVPERNLPPMLSRSISEPDGLFEEEYSCWPPPVCMVIISVIEIIFFIVDMVMYNATEANGPMAQVLMYNPHKRYEAWRYVTYMFVHVGYVHLTVNLIVQIMLGVPLEMVHKGGRVLIIYFAGVIAGSLGTSLTDPTVYLAGASGGVYALITAHIASVIMNWKQMSVPVLQFVIFLAITIADFGTAVYNRYFLEVKDNIGFEAHVAGAVAGLLVGIFILRNLEVNSCERRLWWVSLVTYLALMLTAVIWNAAYPSYFPPQL